MRALIVDDHGVVRRGLKEILAEGFPGLETGEAANQAEALEKAWAQEWDIVLLDIGLPGRSGFDLLVDLKQAKPHLPVIVISMYPEEHCAVRALQCGASSYLTKEAASDELLKAVRRVLGGSKYITATLGEKLARDVESRERKPHESLSNREYQVLCMLACGRTVKEIAGSLCLSVKTISTYRTRILEKMGLTSNAELMHYAARHKLINLQDDGPGVPPLPV
ncbi:MAG: response regulator transcription factor [Verrucomicrobiota bacterium]